MDDLISRQAAIHLIAGYDGLIDKSVAKRLLIQMPSAQPEIITCNQCVHYQQNHHYCEFLNAEFSPSDYCCYAER